MPSPLTIAVPCDKHMIQFYVALFGPMPIVFPKNHPFNNKLEYLLKRPPRDYVPHEINDESLIIQIPFFEAKNVLSNYYFSAGAVDIYKRAIHQFFTTTFIEEISLAKIAGFNLEDSLYAFMDKFELDGQMFDRLKKAEQRFRERKYYQSRRKKLNKNLSVKHRICPKSLTLF